MPLGDFLEGQSQEAQVQQKGLLEMALLSKRMELEAQNRMQEQQTAAKLSMTPASTAAAALQGVAKGDFSGLSASGVDIPKEWVGPLGEAVGHAQGMAMLMDKPQKLSMTDQNGNTRVLMMRPSEMGNGINLGLDHEAEKDIQTGRKSYFAFKNYADGVLGDLQDAVTAKTGIQGLGQAAGLKLNQVFQNNPKAAAFMSNLAFRAGKLDKDELGTLKSTNLIGLTTPATFQTNDTIGTLLQKMTQLKEIGVGAAKTAYEQHQVQFPQDIPELSQPVIPPQAAQAPVVNPIDAAIQRRLQREQALNQGK